VLIDSDGKIQTEQEEQIVQLKGQLDSLFLHLDQLTSLLDLPAQLLDMVGQSAFLADSPPLGGGESIRRRTGQGRAIVAGDWEGISVILKVGRL
jgi:hypothetical protein